MTTILHIDSSAKLEGSATRAITAEAVAALQAKHPGAKIIHRDLNKNPLPPITPEFLAGVFGGGEAANQPIVKLSDTLIDEIFAADVLVIGAPMYNFSVPSQLKAWIDLVMRAGKTFKYGDKGPYGLMPAGKHAIIAVASGGVYSDGAMVPYDHVSSFMNQVLGFIGITDVTVVRAEQQAFGPEAASVALGFAKKAVIDDIASVV